MFPLIQSTAGTKGLSPGPGAQQGTHSAAGLVEIFAAGSRPQAISPEQRGCEGEEEEAAAEDRYWYLLCSSQDLCIPGSQSEVKPTLTRGSTGSPERGQRGHSLCSSGSLDLPGDQ